MAIPVGSYPGTTSWAVKTFFSPMLEVHTCLLTIEVKFSKLLLIGELFETSQRPWQRTCTLWAFPSSQP